jgi:uncharacterized protein
MLTYNVTGLLRSSPGTTRSYPIREDTLSIADDVRLVAPIEGELRLTRTGRSIFAEADLHTALEQSCARCLVSVVAPVAVTLKEEALPSIDLETGKPVDVSDEPDALRLDEHHELDLTEPVREQISLAEPITALCRDDCRGLCITCGTDLNEDPGHHHADEDIDPRLALLAQWRSDAEPN